MAAVSTLLLNVINVTRWWLHSNCLLGAVPKILQLPGVVQEEEAKPMSEDAFKSLLA